MCVGVGGWFKSPDLVLAELSVVGCGHLSECTYQHKPAITTHTPYHTVVSKVSFSLSGALRMAAELLRLLVPVVGVRQQVRDLEGLPVLLGLLQSQHLRLLWSSAWILVQLCQDQDTRAEVRSWGGLQQILRLLNRPVQC